MAMDAIGKLVKVLPEQTGQGKNGTWVKQQFIIETIDQFPKQVCFLAWGEKANDLKQFAPGDTLKISFSLESREYNDRWYTDARAWRIEATEGEAAPAGPAAGYSGGNSAPSRGNAPAPSLTSFTEEDGNELPF